MGFIGLLMLLVMVDVQHDFPLVEIKFNNSVVAKQNDDKSWAVPSYDNVKKIILCVERDDTRCLRSN